MTKYSLATVINGELKRIPLLNTLKYFSDDLCFAVYINGRLLYLPATKQKYVGFPKSFCLYHYSALYYFITRNENLYENLQINCSLRCTQISRVGEVGILTVSVGAQILGLKFSLHFIHSSGDYCCDDFDLVVERGSASKSISVGFASSLASLSEVKKISCDISNTVIELNIYGTGSTGPIYYKDFYFSIKE